MQCLRARAHQFPYQMYRQHLFHRHRHHLQLLHNADVGQMHKLAHRRFLSSIAQAANDRHGSVLPRCPPHVHLVMHLLMPFDESQEWGLGQ